MSKHQSTSVNVTICSGSVVALSVCMLSYGDGLDNVEIEGALVVPCSIPVVDFVTHLYRDLRCAALDSMYVLDTPTTHACSEARRFAMSKLRQPKDADAVSGFNVEALILASAVESIGGAITQIAVAAIKPHISSIGVRNAHRTSTQFVYQCLDGTNVAGDDLPEIVKLACGDFKRMFTDYSIPSTYSPRALSLRAIESELLSAMSVCASPTLIMQDRDGVLAARIDI